MEISFSLFCFSVPLQRAASSEHFSALYPPSYINNADPSPQRLRQTTIHLYIYSTGDGWAKRAYAILAFLAVRRSPLPVAWKPLEMFVTDVRAPQSSHVLK
jgi:hypothetical protein